MKPSTRSNNSRSQVLKLTLRESRCTRPTVVLYSVYEFIPLRRCDFTSFTSLTTWKQAPLGNLLSIQVSLMRCAFKCVIPHIITLCGRSRRSPGPPYFSTKLRPEGRKFFCLEIALPHPYLRVWMTCTPLLPPLSQGLDLASTLRYHHSPLVRIARIGHFTVTDGNDTGVDLVLIQPFLLSYLNHVVLMLTGIFFKHNFYKKLNNSHELKHTNHDLNKRWELGHPLQRPVRQWSSEFWSQRNANVKGLIHGGDGGISNSVYWLLFACKDDLRLYSFVIDCNHNPWH